MCKWKNNELLPRRTRVSVRFLGGASISRSKNNQKWLSMAIEKGRVVQRRDSDALVFLSGCMSKRRTEVRRGRRLETNFASFVRALVKRLQKSQGEITKGDQKFIL